MPDTTPRFAIPFPEDPDSPNDPAQSEARALKIEELLGYAGAQAGAKIIPAEQTRSSASYGLLGTPDRVSGVVIPNDRTLLAIAYRAMWKGTAGANHSYAAIFIGSNQLELAHSASVDPSVQEANTATGHYGLLVTTEGGLYDKDYGSDGLSEVTTGQILGIQPSSVAEGDGFSGFVLAFVDPGTYDVSVRFRADSGATVSVKNRRLYVRTFEHRDGVAS